MKVLDVKECKALVVSDRWLSKVKKDDSGCILWTAGLHREGYGRVGLNGEAVLSHRVALVAAMGRNIAEGMDVGHSCHDSAVHNGKCSGGICVHRRCVNPEHLTEQTRRDNILSGATVAANNFAKQYCPQGHELVESNLIPSHPGRACQTCHLERSKRNSSVISRAQSVLGITYKEYVKTYGLSQKMAKSLIGEVS